MAWGKLRAVRLHPVIWAAIVGGIFAVTAAMIEQAGNVWVAYISARASPVVVQCPASVEPPALGPGVATTVPAI